MDDQQKRVNWWGEYRLSPSESLSLRIGGLSLTVRRERMEWLLTHEWEPGEDPQGDHTWELLTKEVTEGQPARFVMAQTDSLVQLGPALADRPIVTSPRIPLHLLPGEEALLYVGSPLWLRAVLGESSVPLPELPIKRPTDTWFGGSTLDGELCYAVQTRAVLNSEHLSLSMRRATTPLLIQNQTGDLFQVERLKIPVEYLSLYADSGGGLWTEQIVVTHAGDASLTQVKVETGPPARAAAASRVCPPRQTSEEELWSRVFAPVQWFQEFTKV